MPLRTPEARFAALPDYPFQPHYADIDGLRMHYVDEGSGPVVLLLHGEPTWSYLYRKMIPPLVAAGYRVLAPDLIGFGKSDKLERMADYSYQKHVAWLQTWLEGLDLRGITLFVQDWGSLLGLRLAAENEARFDRIMVSNGFLPTGQTPPLAFHVWQNFARFSPVFPIGKIVNSGCVVKLSKAEIAAYDAPFPTDAYKAAARVFPRLVPVSKKDPAVPANLRAWEILGRWHKPVLTVFGKNDPILGKADAALQRHIPGCQNQPHQRIWGGHFIQEDQGAELVRQMLGWLGWLGWLGRSY
jgi:haloalkane dehalogenase